MILSYIMSILAVVALSIISDLVLGGKRMGKFVSAVFASLTILIVVAPIPNMIKNGFSGDLLYIPGVEVDESYIEYANSIKANALSRGMISELNKAGYRNVEVEIVGEFNDEISIKGVYINLRNLVMDENVVHINKYDAIKRIVTDHLNVDEGVIVIYE